MTALEKRNLTAEGKDWRVVQAERIAAKTRVPERVPSHVEEITSGLEAAAARRAELEASGEIRQRIEPEPEAADAAGGGAVEGAEGETLVIRASTAPDPAAVMTTRRRRPRGVGHLIALMALVGSFPDSDIPPWKPKPR